MNRVCITNGLEYLPVATGGPLTEAYYWIPVPESHRWLASADVCRPIGCHPGLWYGQLPSDLTASLAWVWVAVFDDGETRNYRATSYQDVLTQAACQGKTIVSLERLAAWY